MRMLLIAAVLLLILAGTAFAAGKPAVYGAVAYTEVVRFDYEKKGRKANVQFWLEFKDSTASGVKGNPGYRPAGLALFYYLFDVDKKVRVSNWLMGFSMMSEPPPSGPYPITNLVVEGNTARFEAFQMKWTVTDGGTGFGNDTVLVDDGFKPKEMKMYAGDLSIK